MTRYKIPMVDRVEIAGRKKEYALSPATVSRVLSIRDKIDSHVNLVHTDTDFRGLLVKRFKS